MPVQKFPDVSKDDVGQMVQTYVDADSQRVVVTANDDGKTYTVSVTK